MSPVHIIISGASSVGKSTLVEECLRKFRQDKKLKNKQFKRIQEVARTVLNRLKLTGKHLQEYVAQNDIEKFSRVQEEIIREQILRFDEEKDNNYLSDRAGFDALAYIRQYFDNEQKTNSICRSKQFQLLINQCQHGLIFIIQPQEDLQAQNDNMRIVASYKEQIEYTESLTYWYKKANLPYFILTDLDLTKRVEFIQKHINGYFHWLPPAIPIPLCLPFHLNKHQHYGHNNVATPSHSDQSYMRFIEILDKQNIKISYKKYDKNRLVEKYDPSCLNNKFVSILFDQKLDNTFIEDLLFQQILINGQAYNFIGYSNSQLRGRSCYLYAGSTEEIESIINDNGDFHKIKNRSKRAARIGLLFSSCTPTLHIESDHVIEIDDIERNGYTFTDGCGIIGRCLAKKIVPYLNDFKKPLITLNENNPVEDNTCPCAFQIRYQGCKGVLMINDDDEDETIQIRPSMKKFTSTISTCLYVCDDGYSKPKLGFLIKQFIMLLSGLNIPDEIFFKIQKEHFDEIVTMCDDMNVAMKYSLYFDRIDLVYHLLSNDIQLIQSELQILRKKALESVEKLKIPITKSRLALGVCDPFGVLKPGEVYFRPTFNGRQFMIDSKICFVAKSPSYHLGDIRVLKLTSYKQLQYLYDVIVFPTEGRRPHPNEIAGSDLDGDKYLICWDNDLIPKQTNQPMDYNSTAKAQESEIITRKEMISHFANAQKNNQSGIIDNYYNYWANLLGIASIQCRRLAELFSEAVDAPKTGQKIRIPVELKPPRKEEQQLPNEISSIQSSQDNSQSNASNKTIEKKEFVWIKMLNEAKKFKEEFQIRLINENQFKSLTKETLLNILYERRCPYKYNFTNAQSLNEYSLIVTTIKWSNEEENSDEILKDLIYLFDFSQLTMEQKQNVELSLKIDQSYLYSILNKSKILSKELINKYHLSDTCLSWRLFYTSPKLFNISSRYEFEQTLQPIIYVLKQNSLHEKTLINISIDDTITLVLDICKDALSLQPQLANSNESKTTFQIQPGLFNAYLESKLYSIRRKFLLDIDYFLTISKDRIQIYQNDPRNSFIVFMYDVNLANKIISVDLTRFDRNILRNRNHPKVNRHEFFYFEIFVLSGDQQISSSYYPVISYYDEEYYTQNYLNEQIENYQYVEYLTEKEKAEEEKYKNEQRQYEEKRTELMLKYENMSQENIEELINNLMSIHDCEYLNKIWIYLKESGHTEINLNELNEKLLNYFDQEIKFMLNGSIYRPFIDEKWFYDLLLSSINQNKYLNIFFQQIKKFNSKLKDRSQSIYIPFLGRIIQRLIKENDQLIQPSNLINNEFIYNLYLSLILSNDYNTDEINLNYIIEINSLTNIPLTLKQLSHLIQSCLMAKNSAICQQFLQYLSNIQIVDEEQQNSKSTIDYIIQFLSILIRTNVNDLDEINRRIKLKKEILIKNGETIFDLRAKLTIRKSNDQKNENVQQTINTGNNDEKEDDEEEEKCLEPIFCFEHYKYEKIPSHNFNIGDSIALIDQEQLDEYLNKQTRTEEKPPLRLFYQSFGTILSVHPLLSIKFTFWPLSLTNNNYLNRQKLFRLERLPNFVTLNRSIDAFGKIIDNKDVLLIKPFLNLSDDINKDQLKNCAQEQIKTVENNLSNDNEYNHAALNNSQRQAIKHALENRLTLIQGPPGTGKTETSAWIIHLWLKTFFREGQPILICAETHQAVDNLTRRLLQYQQYRLIRYGEPRTVASDLRVN
ncbi:unnamed protein product [Rotaria socialis]|uniref:RNA-directed RNA polymerase n=2 Tax=Rotaria socialis TaxID=392032 RepID=A0A818F8K1_9BILA|nr:unnamed protein product [Rotaria socialis]